MRADWIQLSTDKASKIHPKRSGHTSITTAGGRSLIFGGYVEDGSPSNRYVKNDLWEWNNDMGWQAVEQKGDVPGPRLVSAAAQADDDNALYLFGGWDPGSKGDGGTISDTVHKLDLKSHEWDALDVTLPDGPTSRHVAFSLQNIGKVLLHTHRCTDYVYLFDSEEGFSKQPTQGDAPSSRGLHAGCVLTPNKVVIFGGATQDGKMSNEVFVLDTNNWKWTKIKVSGEEADGKYSPTPRAAPCLCRFSDDCVFLFGGASSSAGGGLRAHHDVWRLMLGVDAGTGKWELLLGGDDDQPDNPPARNAATLQLIGQHESPEQNTKDYVLAGGWDPFKVTHDDCYILKASGS